MAKPLVETLQLKKDKERNPRIRETQVFQEFQQAVNNKVNSIFGCGGGVSNFHSKALSEAMPFSASSLFSVYPSWWVSSAILASILLHSLLKAGPRGGAAWLLPLQLEIFRAWRHRTSLHQVV